MNVCMQSHWKKGKLLVSNWNCSMNVGFFLSFFLLKWVLKWRFFVRHWIQNKRVLNIRYIYTVLKVWRVVGAFLKIILKIFKEWETFWLSRSCYKMNKTFHYSTVSCCTAKKLLLLLVLFLLVTLVHQISIRHWVLRGISTDKLVLGFFRHSTNSLFSVWLFWVDHARYHHSVVCLFSYLFTLKQRKMPIYLGALFWVSKRQKFSVNHDFDTDWKVTFIFSGFILIIFIWIILQDLLYIS